ncbi:HAD hydrolase family protein [Staphylococcus aureus]|nr:HAD hydrolase family protein [Staphylococcus aureus]
MTNYKVVVLDMDDTLLNSDNVISEETANYLTAIQDEGYYVVLASGRPTEGMIPTARDLKLPEHHSYIISYNGSKTINMTNEEVEVSKSIGKQDFDEIVDYCRDRGFFVLTYHDGQIIYDSEHEYMNIEAELTGLPMKRVDDIKAYLFTHLKELFSEESFAENQSAFNITVYTNLDYTADQIYAHVKRFRGKHDWTQTAK